MDNSETHDYDDVLRLKPPEANREPEAVVWEAFIRESWVDIYPRFVHHGLSTTAFSADVPLLESVATQAGSRKGPSRGDHGLMRVFRSMVFLPRRKQPQSQSGLQRLTCGH